MYEIMTLHPLFPGANEVDQVNIDLPIDLPIAANFS